MSTFVPQGKIELIKNVDIDVSYTHQYYFSTLSAQTTFFGSKVFKTLTNGTYQRKNINSLQVPYQADEIAECKYLRWQNPNYSEKYYYAFVTSIDYVNPGVSQINYQLDVYQTYLFDVEWKQSFIDRKHADRWYTEGGLTLPYVNTMDEALDYGSTFRQTKKVEVKQFDDSISFMIIGITSDTNGTYTVGGVPSSLSYYIVPVMTAGTRTQQFTYSNNVLSRAYEVLDMFRNDSKFVNSLVSCIIVPFVTLYDFDINYNDSTGRYDITGSSVTVQSIAGNSHTFVGLRLANDTFGYSVPKEIVSNKYSGFPTYSESKLLMYPYSFIELTTNRGDTMIIKPEYIEDNGLTIAIAGSVSYQNKMAIMVKDYLISTQATSGNYEINGALIDNSNENMPIVDNYTASYLQSNSNSLQVSQSNARALQQVQQTNAQATYKTRVGNEAIQMGGATLAAGANLLGDLAVAMLNPAMAGGALSNAVGSASGLITSGASMLQGLRSAETDKANTFRSTNVDYQNAVNTAMAKIKDAEQVPANARSLGGNYIFDTLYGCSHIYLYWKTIQTEYADKLTDYFKQYGYKVNSLEVPNFHTRTSWNYIKMVEPNVYGNIPMDDLMKIRDIFLKGITLWHGDYIGDYSLSNAEL